MLLLTENISYIYSASFSKQAEAQLMSILLEEIGSRDPWSGRRLATYPLASEEEKDELIRELMERYWMIDRGGKLFKVFSEFERILSVLERKGHYIHSFEVFLLGWFLIRSIINRKGTKIFARRSKLNDNLFLSWLIASTAHDFGYPFEIASELSLKISKLYRGIHLTGLANRAKALSDSCIEDQRSLLFIEAYNVVTKKNETIDAEKFVLKGISRSLSGSQADAREIVQLLRKKKNHGYISALILTRTYIDYLSENRMWKKKGKEWVVELLELLVGAIAVHGMKLSHKKYIKMLSLRLNPIAYLLFLIDNIQDWNRSLNASDKYPSYNLINFVSSTDKIQINYKLSHDCWTKKREEEVVTYLTEKDNLLKMLRKPIPAIGITLVMHFTASNGRKFKAIRIAL